MERIPEPEIMDQPEQVLAYARADFSIPHNALVECFSKCFPGRQLHGEVLDIGCGPADFTLRMARAYPGARFLAIDGSQPMLDLGRRYVQSAGLSHRIRLENIRLPSAALPSCRFDAVISNSLLHHLHQPDTLWHTVQHCLAPGGLLFIADLLRPEDEGTAKKLVKTYSGDEPQILQRDFYHSLLAAFRPDEIRQQLSSAGLSDMQIRIVSDRHLVIFGAQSS